MKTKLLLLLLPFCLQQAQQIPTPEMVAVEGGTFLMGNNSFDAEDDEKPAHQVTLSSFSIAKYEVTVGEYKAFSKASGTVMSTPSIPPGNDKYPMTDVSFEKAVAYCNWLSQITKKNYGLPTEAEWEYAARGGNKSKGYTYSGSNAPREVGWIFENSRGQSHSCGLKKPNELGIYDMTGNVLEWCSDYYNKQYYAGSPLSNPTGPLSGFNRVLRGGCFSQSVTNATVSCRSAYPPTDQKYRNGFRVVCR